MSSYVLPNINQRPPTLVDDGYYTEIKVDASTYSPTIYVGLHLDKGATTSSSDWKIYKIIPSGSDVEIQVLYGIFDNRNSL